MGSAPVKENAFASFINKLISMLVTGVAAPVIEKFAEEQFPPLALPVVKQIFEHLVDKYAGKLSFAMQDGALTIVIDIQTDAELRATLKSLADLQEAHKRGNPDEIKKAVEKAMDDWGDIIHWDGIATKH